MAKVRGQITVSIDESMCKGCGLCVAVCPRHSMDFSAGINARGFHPAYCSDPDSCTGCAQCALMCPDACIAISRLDSD